MQPALWISKTGLSAQDTKLATISNNLANVNTTGFKKDRAIFQDLMYQIKKAPGTPGSESTNLPSGLQIGSGVRVGATKKEFTQGSMEITNQALDVAVNGRGFLQVLMPDGTTAYTRDGKLQVDSTGQIVNSSGFPIQPAITIPANASLVTISRDGIVTANDPTTNQPTQLGQLTLSDFVNPAGLQAIGDNLFIESAASGAPQTAVPSQNGLGTLLQGQLESSNVNIVEEMVDMITTQRAYEMNSKVIATADQMLQFITQNT